MRWFRVYLHCVRSVRAHNHSVCSAGSLHMPPDSPVTTAALFFCFSTKKQYPEPQYVPAARKRFHVTFSFWLNLQRVWLNGYCPYQGTLLKKQTMKIVLTGSLGHISKPLAVQLIAAGHELTLISSKADRKKEIEALGAKALIGQMEDAEFIAGAFAGAEIVYCMEIVGRHLMTGDDFTLDVMVDKVKQIVSNYKAAIEKNGIKKVIHLSSIGAHTNEGVGLLKFHFEAEKILNSLPGDVSVKFMRPVGFYYNLLDNAPMIRQLSQGFVGTFMALRYYGLGGLFSGKRGLIVSNYGGQVMNMLVSPLDIAHTIAEEMDLPFSGRSVRYIASEELTCDEVAAILGKAIGKPYLKWGTLSDKQLKDILVKYKLNPSIAQGIVDMGASGRRGDLYTDYYAHRPKLAPTKLVTYLPEFVKAYEAAPDQNNQ